jgi:hypothetical protein
MEPRPIYNSTSTHFDRLNVKAQWPHFDRASVATKILTIYAV